MANTIHSSIIGTLTQDGSIPEWWISDPVEIPFLAAEKFPITFTELEPLEDSKFIAEADKALQSFLALTINDRHNLSALVNQNCKEFLEMVDFAELDEELKNIKDPNDIWKFVYPTEIYVSRRSRRDQDIYISISCNCEWEQEHGLQLVFRQGKKLTRISSIDGHLTESDAYDTPDEEDKLLSKF
jgi:hypothetical protein